MLFIFKLLTFAGILDAGINGDPVKRYLRYLSKRTADPAFRVLIGGAYGCLDLYGYSGCAGITFNLIRKEYKRWQTQKNVSAVKP